jgi:hypothetical protein
MRTVTLPVFELKHRACGRWKAERWAKASHTRPLTLPMPILDDDRAALMNAGDDDEEHFLLVFSAYC